MPYERATCTHSSNDSSADQKTAGSRSSGFHHSAWNICSCTSVIGISSFSRIITAVMKWWPVPSAPATKTRFVWFVSLVLISGCTRAYGRQNVVSSGVRIASFFFTDSMKASCASCSVRIGGIGGGVGAPPASPNGGVGVSSTRESRSYDGSSSACATTARHATAESERIATRASSVAVSTLAALREMRTAMRIAGRLLPCSPRRARAALRALVRQGLEIERGTRIGGSADSSAGPAAAVFRHARRNEHVKSCYL